MEHHNSENRGGKGDESFFLEKLTQFSCNGIFGEVKFSLENSLCI